MAGQGCAPGGGGFAELMQLLEQDIPECRRHLQDSHTNLDKVAAYCLTNYLQAPDKRHALEETKSYTTQSLASVAYQINMLATNFLHLLDLQMVQISDMESSINHLSQIVMIHKEKVARREIGELTTNKATTRPPGVKNPGIIFPDQPERPMKYIRKPIDYSALDDIGHGIRPAQSQNAQMRRNSANTNRPTQQQAGGGGPPMSGQLPGHAPTTHPPTTPTMYAPGQGAGSMLRKPSASSPYRAPAPPVSPPSVPGNYAPNYPQQAPSTPQSAVPMGTGSLRRNNNYAPGGMMMAPQGGQGMPPPMRMVAPMPQLSVGGTPLIQGSNLPPPLMHDNIRQQPYISDPIPMADYRSSSQIGNVSPPLPPPPGVDSDDRFVIQKPTFDNGGSSGHGIASTEYAGDYARENYASRMSRMHQDESDWIPASYLEKVVAIYNYQQDKDDELTFDEGAVIYVVKKNDDGWWEGVMDGHTGLFPGNYVEPCI